MPSTLVIGSRNPKKKREILEILGDLPIDLQDLTEHPEVPEVVEDADTFAGNAEKKATEVAVALGQWTLGEDSGLVVPALGGAPGVYSARYAGTQGDDEANNAKLLRELESKPDEQRGAYYVSTAVLSDPEGTVHAVVAGECHGVILREARGEGGFGYDPLFLVPEFHKTFGELPSRVKHALSHRGRALAKLRPHLRKLFAESSS